MEINTNTTQITNLYNDVLNRAPDKQGLQHYLQLLQNGYTIDTIRQRMTNSNEYITKHQPIQTNHQPIQTNQCKPLLKQPLYPSTMPKHVLKKQKLLEKRKKGRIQQPTVTTTVNKEFKIPNVDNFEQLGVNAELLCDFYFEHSTIYTPYYKHKNISIDDVDNTLTVVITNWRRPERLIRCVESVTSNNIHNIVITSAETNPEVINALRQIVIEHPYIRIIATPYDPGCNWTWLSGVYMVNTPYLLVLHDDDILSHEFEETYKSIIKPHLQTGNVGHVYWDGVIYDVNKNEITDEYYRNAMGHAQVTDLYPPHEFYERYKSNKSVYPLSPVVQILHTYTAKQTLKECELNLTDPVFIWPRKTMILGNDVMLCLRNLQYCIKKNKQTMYINKALTCYGRWKESVSQMAIDQNESPQFREGYIALREYYRTHETINVNYPMVIHVTSFYKPRSENDLRRHKLALTTWIRQYTNKQMLFCPLYDSQLTRSSKNVGSKLYVPFIRDIFDYGFKFCLTNDVIAFCNSDICMVDNIMRYALPSVNKYGCTYSFRRDAHTTLNRLLKYNEIEKETRWYVGMDFTAFKKSWWSNWRGMTTDNLIGFPTWDFMMRFVMSYSYNPSYAISTPVKELGKAIETPNVIYHEKHDSYAERPENYKCDITNIYCFTNMTYFLLHYYSKENILKLRPYIMNLDLILKYINKYNDDKFKVIDAVYKDVNITTPTS